MLNNYSTFSAYTFLGLGATMFFPNTDAVVRVNQNNGDVYDQIDGYGFIAVSVPLGIGVKYIIDDKWLAGAEVGYRWTTSDFLDGYKQLFNSKYNDEIAKGCHHLKAVENQKGSTAEFYKRLVFSHLNNSPKKIDQIGE